MAHRKKARDIELSNLEKDTTLKQIRIRLVSENNKNRVLESEFDF